MTVLTRTAFLMLLASASLLLTACSKPDPKVALEAAVQELQDRLEAKDSGAVLAMLDPLFRAQDEYDAEWARKTMALVFLRYASVKIIAVSSNSYIDPPGSAIGVTEAQVVLTGAQGLIPERVSPYSVQLRWKLEGSDWKLYDLRWE